PDMEMAKGQLAASAVLALGLKPHIIHVVGYTEGDHAATADEVIESCKIVRGVLKNCMFGMPDAVKDERVTARKDELVNEAKQIVESIKSLGDGSGDPLTSPEIISSAMKIGILDAPQLAGNPEIAGRIKTACINGAIYAIHPEDKTPLAESDRLRMCLPGS
ncbi:MAG TPA: methionine synthase, partial [Armatimonadota bacterium]|nr:methionine synthase [Armatimonadota bacterium]